MISVSAYHKINYLSFLTLFICVLLHFSTQPLTAVNFGDFNNAQSNKKQRPNILFILADDIGYANLGYNSVLNYNSTTNDQSLSFLAMNVSTTLTRLATVEGRILQRHYTYLACTPSRSSFQSGRLPVHVTQKLQEPCEKNSGMPGKMTGIGEIMSRAGYNASMIGKWDCGMTTWSQIPYGKGYNNSLIFFSHAIWPNSQQYISNYVKEQNPVPSEVPKCPNPGKDGCLIDFWENDHPAKDLQGTDYVEEIFVKRVISTIEDNARNGNKAPFFIVYAPRFAHYPLDAPFKYQNKVRDLIKQNAKYPSQVADQKISLNRLIYHAQIYYLDESVQRIVDTLKSTMLWDNTLIVFSSDNGGDIYPQIKCFERGPNDFVCPEGGNGATNYPLRGGKGSFFEGGIRVTAFISGGIIQKDKVAKPINKIIHLSDWYATFAHAAGIDDITDKKSGNLPKVDSINMWKTLELPDLDNDIPGDKGNTRTNILLSETAMISGRYKILFGKQPVAGYSGPFYPFDKSISNENPSAKYIDCGLAGCVFDLESDSREQRDISKSNPGLAIKLKNEFIIKSKTIWKRTYNGIDPSCSRTARDKYGGFLGPWILI